MTYNDCGVPSTHCSSFPRSGRDPVDMFSAERRSEIMSRIKSTDTKPEKLVRSLVHRMGYRFRLHRKDMPGKPDLVLPRCNTVVFVHGCFWHGHTCKSGHKPKSNKRYWNKKLDGNKERDRKNARALRRQGWKVIIVWECETANEAKLERRLRRLLPRS